MTTSRSNSKTDPNLRFNIYEDDKHLVRVTQAGSTIIATPTTEEKLNSKHSTVPYDKGHRLNIDIGEITEVKHSKTGSHCQNIYRTVSQISQLALTNFSGGNDEVFITLTYADPANHTLKSNADIYTPCNG